MILGFLAPRSKKVNFLWKTHKVGDVKVLRWKKSDGEKTEIKRDIQNIKLMFNTISSFPPMGSHV